MVIINELRITPDGNYLIVDASVENLSYYKNVNIAAVIIDTQDTWIASGPSNRAVFHYSVGDDMQDPIHKDKDCGCTEIKSSQTYGNKNLRIKISCKDIGVSLKDNIFFVYIITNGAPEPCTPCGMDIFKVMGVTYNLHSIYNIGMNYIRELKNNCIVPRNFIDYILKFKALQLALKTGNYPIAINYWNTLFKSKVTNTSKPNSCGCQGNY